MDKKEKLYSDLADAFNMGVSAPAETIFSMPVAELLMDPANMDGLLEAHMPLIATETPDASAISVAIAASNLAFAQQYAIAVYGTAIDLNVNNLVLHLFMKDGYEAFGYTLRQWGAADEPSEGGREEWLQETLNGTYRHTITPIIESAARAGALHPRELWGQLPTDLRYYMGVWREAAESERILEKLEEVYSFLGEGLDASAFGASANPYLVEPRWTESLEEPGVRVPLKNTCCLFYKWGSGSYCFACPRLKETEREARRAECRGA